LAAFRSQAFIIFLENFRINAFSREDDLYAAFINESNQWKHPFSLLIDHVIKKAFWLAVIKLHQFHIHMIGQEKLQLRLAYLADAAILSADEERNRVLLAAYGSGFA
jgi:cytolysin (calcineurin-like family phosphatase)